MLCLTNCGDMDKNLQTDHLDLIFPIELFTWTLNVVIIARLILWANIDLGSKLVLP